MRSGVLSKNLEVAPEEDSDAETDCSDAESDEDWIGGIAGREALVM